MKEPPEEIARLEKDLKENIVWSPPVSKIKRFNYFMKDKEGNELSFKEFCARWKKGMEGITPLQQITMQYKSTWIMIIGILCGIVVVGMVIKELWWLLVILVGALFNTVVQQLGTWQKKRVFEAMVNVVDGEEHEGIEGDLK